MRQISDISTRAGKVCSYLHDGGFSYPKAANAVVICPLNALIDSHILELKENPKTVNSRNINCGSRRKPVTREKTKSAFLWDDPKKDESTLTKDSSVPLMHHDPSDLGSVILFRIIPKERTLNRKHQR